MTRRNENNQGKDNHGRRIVADMVKTAPRSPGVYLMKDGHERIIYVGKAKDLRARLRNYAGGTDTRPMIPFLMARISRCEYIVTATEKEALILENTLIKKHRPRYNVTLRDDKNYFCIRVDMTKDFPRFELVRRIRQDGARYFGPYSSSAAVKKTLHFLQQVVPLRTCRDREFALRQRPCMEYEIKRCLAPCCGLITKEDYRELLDDAVLFLEGKERRLLGELKMRMKRAAHELDFETAALLRDRIAAIEETLEKQRIVSRSAVDRDVIGLSQSDDTMSLCVLFVRGGTVTGRKTFPLFSTKEEMPDVLASFVKQYYDDERFIPDEIIVPVLLDDRTVIEEWLTEKRGTRTKVVVPQRGERRDILTAAVNNARDASDAARSADVRRMRSLERIGERLALSHTPRRIECVDISTMGGRYAVGSLVSFVNGERDTKGYRRYRIKTRDGTDDYGMMREVLARRFSSREDYPDLLMVDGGKGQVAVACAVLRDRAIIGVDVIGIAKESRRTGGGVATDRDRFYIPMRKNPLYLPVTGDEYHLLQRIRDEAHRFAITYHRTVKGNEDMRSRLDDICGVGEERKKQLLSHFRDYEAIRRASPEELAAIPGIGRRLSQIIHNGLRRDPDA